MIDASRWGVCPTLLRTLAPGSALAVCALSSRSVSRCESRTTLTRLLLRSRAICLLDIAVTTLIMVQDGSAQTTTAPQIAIASPNQLATTYCAIFVSCSSYEATLRRATEYHR
jgi:hypothetical protein